MKLNNRIELAKYFYTLGFRKGAEIGVADGKFSQILCKVNPGLKLLCVDPWRRFPQRGGGSEKQELAYQMAKKRLSGYNCSLVEAFSIEVAQDTPDNYFDFVFIDGNHKFDY